MNQPRRPHGQRGFLEDPDLLGVPADTASAPLTAPVTVAAVAVPVPAPRDHEPLTPVTHRRVRLLAAYWHAGWPCARPGTFLRQEVADRLGKAAESLPDGFGLAVLDAWRPLALQAEIHAAAYADPDLPYGFVAPPSTDPGLPPAHLTGGAVDVTLTWQHRPLALGSDFDEFTGDAHPLAFENRPGRVRELRRLLHAVMTVQEFVGDGLEWWHFELGTGRWAAATGQTPWYGAADTVHDETPYSAAFLRDSRPT